MLLNDLCIFEINGSKVIFGEQVFDPVCQDVLSPRLEIVISVAGAVSGGLPKTPAFGGAFSALFRIFSASLRLRQPSAASCRASSRAWAVLVFIYKLSIFNLLAYESPVCGYRRYKNSAHVQQVVQNRCAVIGIDA